MIDRELQYNIDDLYSGSIPEAEIGVDLTGDTPAFQNSFSDGVDPSTVGSGETVGNQTIKDGYLQSSNFVSGSTGWKLTPTSAELNVSTALNSLDVPDTTTANSAHIESDGDTFWGATNANFTSNNDNAPAYVLKTGVAKFQSISVGGTTTQYQINNDGIFSFGDGSDGALTTSGNVTLTSDKYYTNLTIATGHTFNPAGYRVFCTGTLTEEGTGKIVGDGGAGNAGGNASNDTPGAAGAASAALADGYLKGSVAGVVGLIGAGTNNPGNAGTAGTATSNSIGDNGSAGGVGGKSGANFQDGGAVGSGGTATPSNVKLIANWHLATLLDIASSGSTVKYDNSAGAGSGGSGGGGNTPAGANVGGAGGGSGSGGTAGRMVAIYARSIVIGASASITSNGGAGGAGGNGGNASGTGSAAAYGGGGAAGGAGGNGGQIILVYNTLTNSGSIAVTGGSGGTGGTGGANKDTGGSGETGGAGTAGSVGTIRQFSISL